MTTAPSPNTPRTLYLPLLLLATGFLAGCNGSKSGPPPADTAIATISPIPGEQGVATQRPVILQLSGKVRRSSVTPAAIRVLAQGNELPTRLHLSPDRSTLSVFPNGLWPSAGQLTLEIVDGQLLGDNGRPIDADGDGLPGGSRQVPFRIVDLQRVPDTQVCGRVFASEPDGNGFDVPLAGVLVTVDGLETECVAVTDALGNFCLQDAPAGDVFVHVRGGTATRAPAGFFYPDVGKLWHTVAGQRITVGTIFLPAVSDQALQPVSRTAATPVRIAEAQLQRIADPKLVDLLRRTQVTVPADSLFAANGQRGGRVGIGPVNRDRLPGELPEGLELPIVITIQTDGPGRFDVPVPVVFPNLPNPVTGQLLPPGAKSALWSFNHDTGDFEVVGPMTVSPDGLTVVTDPGVGVLAPGWHGAAPGTPGSGGPPNNPEEPQCDPSFWDLTQLAYKIAGDLGECALELAGVRNAWQCWIEWKNFIGSIMDQAETLRQAVQQRTISPAMASALLDDLLAKKNDAIAVLGCVDAVDPTTRITKVVTCTQSILNTLRNLCELNEGRCLNIVGRSLLCPLIATAAQLLNEAQTWADVFQEWKNNARAEAVCLAVQSVVALVRFYLNPPQGLDGSTIDPQLAAELLRAIDDLAGAIQAERAVEPAFAGSLGLVQPCESLASQSAAAVSASIRGNSTPAPSRCFYALDLGAGQPRRGQTTELGSFSLMLPANTFYRLAMYDPDSGNYGEATGRTAPEGRATTLHAIPMTDTAGMTDTDQDGLPDDIEYILGTREDVVDTDGDGVSDYQEVLAGTDPLDGLGGRVRLVADLPTVGPAIDLCAEDGALIAACGNAGIEIWNAWQNMAPTSVARLDTPGAALRVACSQFRVAVADGAAGLALVDLSIPAIPVLRHQLQLGFVQAVAANGRTAIAGTATGRIAVVDFDLGTVWMQHELGTAIVDLQLDGDWVYALSTDSLHVLRLSGGVLVAVRSLPLGRANQRRLVRAQDHLLAVHWRGLVTVDITQRAQPQILANTDTNQLGWRHLALDGSGNALAVVGLNSDPDPTDDLRLYRLDNFAAPATFVGEFTGPDFPDYANGTQSAVVIYNGFAYTTDRRGRLFCVRYQLRDFGQQAPQINLSTAPFHSSIEEGTTFVLRALVSDDVQVSHVDFEQDGVRLTTDGTYPFEIRLVAPPRTAATTLTLRARCWDTGGNLAVATELVLPITPDLTPPSLLRTIPGPNGVVQAGQPLEWAAVFSEAIRPSTIQATSLSVVGAGPDGVLGTSDDEPVAVATAQWRPELQLALWTSAAPLAAQRYRVTLIGITDVAGNEMALANAEFMATTGLRVRFFQQHDYSSIAGFFASGTPLQVTEYRAGTGPVPLSTTMVPNVHFPTANGNWAIHAGADGIYQTTSGTAPVGDDIVWNLPDRFGMLLEGMLTVPESGTVTLRMTIDDSFVVELGGQVVFQYLGCTSPTTFVSAPIQVTAGNIPIRIAAADVCGSHFHLALGATGAGLAGNVIPASSFGGDR
jgi:hypothetical protein